MQLELGFKHRLHLDYETFSECDIRAGSYLYARHPSTEVLMLGWALDDDPAQLWLPTNPMPAELEAALRDPTVSKHAYNAQFERHITEHILKIEIPLHHWRCTMVEAYYLAFAGTLDQVLKAVGLPPKHQKGKQLLNKFCTPAPKNHKADRYTAENCRKGEWESFCDYCVQDVEVERQLWHFLRKYPGMHAWDWQQWFLDQQINDRGVYMDLEMADAAKDLWEKERARLTAELSEITGGRVTRGPFKQWLEDHLGYELDNLRKDYLPSISKRIEDDPSLSEVHLAIDLWTQKEGKAVSKYTAAAKGVAEDGRARGMFQYKGASRTDRVGGRRIQLQNLRRPFAKTFAQIDTAVSAIKLRSPEMLRALYPQSVSDTVGGAVRHMITASLGNTLAVADLSSIESVVLGWLTYCDLIDQTFRSGRDTYKVFGERYYGVPYDDITKDQRTFCKPPVLGCGYMLGWKGLILYAEGMGVDMTAKEAKSAVSTFREMYPEVVDFWGWIYDAVKRVTIRGETVQGYRMTIERDADFLRIWLPSGRALSYYKPDVREKVAPWWEPKMTEKAEGAPYEAFIAKGWTDAQLVAHGYMKNMPEMLMNFCYMGMSDNNQWVRIFCHAGGLTENIVQSIAGDILWSGITNANAAGLPVVLHVHDEIGCEVPEGDGEASVRLLEACMTKQPDWCQDMWLGANGYYNRRYTKD